MRMDKLTSKFQAALADAQSLAVGRDHQFIEPVHVMLSLLDQQGGTVRPLLVKAGANPERVHTLSFGKEKPAAQGTSEDARAQNRRAELSYR